MTRTTTLILFVLGLGCFDSQDHGAHDDGGVSDGFPIDAPVDASEQDAGPADGSASLDSAVGADAPDTDGGPDAGPEFDSGPRDIGASVVQINAALSYETRMEWIGGVLVSRPHATYTVSVLGDHIPARRETDPPIQTIGACSYWPPLVAGSGEGWPPGTTTTSEPALLLPGDISLLVNGRELATTVNAGTVTGRSDYERGATVEVFVRLSSGTIRRTLTMGDVPLIDEPVAMPSATRSGFVGEYLEGEPLAVRWPLTSNANDFQTVQVAGGEASLWALCELEHGDRELVFPWEDVERDFLGSGEMGNEMNLIWRAGSSESVMEGRVEVRLTQSRITRLFLLPAAL